MVREEVRREEEEEEDEGGPFAHIAQSSPTQQNKQYFLLSSFSLPFLHVFFFFSDSGADNSLSKKRRKRTEIHSYIYMQRTAIIFTAAIGSNTRLRDVKEKMQENEHRERGGEDPVSLRYTLRSFGCT
jgi:hypothetical protein